MAKYAALLISIIAAIALSSCVDPGWSFPTGFDGYTARLGYDAGGAANAAYGIGSALARVPRDRAVGEVGRSVGDPGTARAGGRAVPGDRAVRQGDLPGLALEASGMGSLVTADRAAKEDGIA